MQFRTFIGLLALTAAGCSSSTARQAAPASPASSSVAASPTAALWPTYQRDAARTGVDPTPSTATGPTRQWTTQTLDGQLYGQPLEVGGHVIVATEGDTVYALNPATGAVQWQQHVGSPVPRSALPCGNIDPSGITGTPVIDPAASLVWAVAFVQPGTHDLVALDLATGAVRSRRSIDPPGASPLVEQQRGALTLSGGRVYVPFGGLFGDCGNYHGYVVSAPLNGSGGLQYWQAPSTREEGIWAPPGPVIDGQGRIFVATGNGTSTSTFDDSNAVVHLSAALAQQDVFAPSDWVQLNKTDADIGSVSPTLVGSQVFQVGKRGVGYLLSADHLGGVGGQQYQRPVCSGGAFGGTAVNGTTIYVPCRDGLVALDVSGGQFSVRWRSPGSAAGTPSVAGGVVWSLSVDGQVLGLDPSTGTTLFRSQVPTSRSLPSLLATGGRLFVPSDNTLVAFRY
jgi:outer membrane protein assembly factor BamB